MSEEKELKLACLHQAGGDLDHAQRLFDWVSGSVRATPDSEAAEVSAPKQDKPQQPFNYRHPSKYGTDVPRRCYLEELTPEERAIRDLVDTVERLGAHPLLTATVIQLMKAGEDLADWVDIGLRDKAIAALSPGNDLGLLDENPAAGDTEVRNKAEGEAWHRYVVKGGEDYCDYATLAEAEAAFAKLTSNPDVADAALFDRATLTVREYKAPPSPDPDVLLENQPGVSSQASSGEVARKAELEEANRGEIIRKIAAANAYHEVRFGDRWRVGSELESQPGVSSQASSTEAAAPKLHLEWTRFSQIAPETPQQVPGYTVQTTYSTADDEWVFRHMTDEERDNPFKDFPKPRSAVTEDAKASEALSELDSQSEPQDTTEQETGIFQSQTEAALNDKDEPDPAPYAHINEVDEPAGDAEMFGHGIHLEIEAKSEAQKFNPYRLFRQKVDA